MAETDETWMRLASNRRPPRVTSARFPSAPASSTKPASCWRLYQTGQSSIATRRPMPRSLPCERLRKKQVTTVSSEPPFTRLSSPAAMCAGALVNARVRAPRVRRTGRTLWRRQHALRHRRQRHTKSPGRGRRRRSRGRVSGHDARVFSGTKSIGARHFILSPLSFILYCSGEVREWLNRAVSKTVEPERVPWVRIPPSPPGSKG